MTSNSFKVPPERPLLPHELRCGACGLPCLPRTDTRGRRLCGACVLHSGSLESRPVQFARGQK